MQKKHRSVKYVKEYLLGALTPEESDQFEDEYFADPKFLEWVKEVEESMIAEYIRGGLAAAERRSFQDRYMAVPELQQRYDEVRCRTPVKANSWMEARWSLPLACFGVLLCILTPWIYWQKRTASTAVTAQTRTVTPLPGMIEISLAPGLIKGAGSKQTEFSIPPGRGVRLLFELPGQADGLDCTVVISKMDAVGRLAEVWKSPSTKTTPSGSGQVVRAEIDSKLLAPDDYIARIFGANGSILESFSFRIAAK
jgi:hypothetical protein